MAVKRRRHRCVFVLCNGLIGMPHAAAPSRQRSSCCSNQCINQYNAQVVVNNAGIGDSRAPFDQVTEQELLDCFQVQRASILITALPSLARSTGIRALLPLG